MAKFKSKIAYLLALFVPVTFSQEVEMDKSLMGIQPKAAGSEESASQAASGSLSAGAIAAAVAAAAALAAAM